MILYTDKHHMPFQIDDDDYEAVSYYRWRVGGKGYPATTIGKCGRQRQMCLHRFLMGLAPAGLEWDHINRDKLDNRRANLRAVTKTVNVRNIGLRADNASGIKGVGWHPSDRRWRARISINGRLKFLGNFNSLQAATAARLAAEKLYWDGGEP